MMTMRYRLRGPKPLIGEYQSDRNAIRYMCVRLAHGDFPPGWYQLETHPRETDGLLSKPPAQFVANLYRRA